MEKIFWNALTLAYVGGNIGTVIYLTFFDGYVYNWWNWLIAIPVNFVLGTMWPIYWLILKPLQLA